MASNIIAFGLAVATEQRIISSSIIHPLWHRHKSVQLQQQRLLHAGFVMKERERRRVVEGLLYAHKAKYVSMEQVQSFGMMHPMHSKEEYLKQRQKRRLSDVNAKYSKLECKTRMH